MIRVALPFGPDIPVDKHEAYVSALRMVGIEPIVDATTMDGLDGLLLMGGIDIDPALYGEEPAPQTNKPDRERDAREVKLLKECLDRDLPVLATCRGTQLLNVILGGTLQQHIEGHRHPNVQDVHMISIEPSSRLSKILGVNSCSVNSTHHQSIGEVAKPLIVTAKAPDGIIEAVELPEKHFVIGVQWHPEQRPGQIDAKLFSAFRNAIQSPRP